MDMTWCSQWGLCCLSYKQDCTLGVLDEHTSLCKAHLYINTCAFLRAAITESTKEGKTLQRGTLLAKRTSLGLKRGLRLFQPPMEK